MLRRAAFVALLASAIVPRARAQRLEIGDGSAVSIERYHADALVEEGIARVEIDQTFRSRSSRVEEGIFRFKLPDDAVIGSFSMWMEGREKQARVMDATAARATYDAIVRKQRDPGLLEQVGWREFRVNVFPIPARDTVRVKLVYAHAMRDDVALETLEIPLPVNCGAIADVQVRAQVRAARGAVELDCPSHPAAAIERDARGGCVGWSGQGVTPPGPFVLRSILGRRGFDVTLLTHRDPRSSGGWFVARIVPGTADAPRIARDVVFVIDRSGSMAHDKIEQARVALIAGLDTLAPEDRFAIVSFASDVTSLGDALLPATPENLELGRRFARDLSASGGTALHAALLVGLQPMLPDPTRFRAVVLLTDGEPTIGVTDPAQILASWRKSSAGARLFAFGVGKDVRDFLLTKLAAEGRGDARYVREGDDLEIPLSAFFERVRAPLLLDPQVEIEGDGLVITEREPRRLPDVFRGRTFLVCGRFDEPGSAILRLRGRSGNDELRLDVPVEFPDAGDARPHLAQMWAKTRVERLLDDLRVLGPNQELRDEIRSLGLEHGLVTPYTSFLVVEDGVKVADAGDGTPEARVPGSVDGTTPPGNPGGPGAPSGPTSGTGGFLTGRSKRGAETGSAPTTGGSGARTGGADSAPGASGMRAGPGMRKRSYDEAEQWETWWKQQEPALLHDAFERAIAADGHANEPALPDSPPSRELLVSELLRALGESQLDVVSAAALALGRVAGPKNGRAVKALTRALAHPEAEVREAATLALGMLGSKGPIGALRALLLDDEEGRALAGRPDGVGEQVSARAATSLGLLAASTAIDDLMKAVAGAPIGAKKEVAPMAVLALGLMRERQEEIAAFLVEVMANRGLDSTTRSQAPIALGKLGSRSAEGHEAVRKLLPTVLLQRMDDDKLDPQIRRSLVLAVGTIARPDDAEVVDTLHHFVERSGRCNDLQMRVFAILALGEIGAREPAVAASYSDARIRDVLLRQLTQPKFITHQPFGALALALCLRGRTGSAEAVAAGERILDAFRTTSNPSYRGAMALSLALLGHRAAIDDLTKAFEETNDQRLKGQIALALALLGDRSLAPKLRDFAAHDGIEPAARLDVARALRLLGDRQAAPAVVATLGQATTLHSAALTIRTLGSIGGNEAAKTLLEVLADPAKEPIARSFAACELGRVGENASSTWRLDLGCDSNYRARPAVLAELLDL